MTWKRTLKRIAVGFAALVALALIVGGVQIFRFGRAADAISDIQPLSVVASTDSAVLERGRHIVSSIGGCTGCHGPALAGGKPEEIGPIAVMSPPNLTRGRGGVGGNYTDGELARAIRHGVGSDGRSLIFMPTPEMNWWPDDDLVAVVSYLRTVPPVDATTRPTVVLPLGKVLHQFGVMKLLSAQMGSDDVPSEPAPSPEPTARYGAFLARGCAGCHGETLGGGKLPAAPASLPVPANLTPHATGLGSWTQEQFVTVLKTGVRPDGRKLDPFMPVASTRNMSAVEMDALWEYLRTVEPREFGSR